MFINYFKPCSSLLKISTIVDITTFTNVYWFVRLMSTSRTGIWLLVFVTVFFLGMYPWFVVLSIQYVDSAVLWIQNYYSGFVVNFESRSGPDLDPACFQKAYLTPKFTIICIRRSIFPVQKIEIVIFKIFNLWTLCNFKLEKYLFRIRIPIRNRILTSNNYGSE